MRTIRHGLSALAVAVLTAGIANAQIITQWDFNSVPPDGNTATGTTTPAIGLGTASLVGGTTATFASGDSNGGSSDPATGDDSGWNTTTYPSQGTASRTAGAQFAVSTAGFFDISVSWDQRHSNTSARHIQFQYSTDGTNFTDFGALFEGTAGDTWFNGRSVNLTGVSGVSDNPNFAFRVVSAFDPTLGDAYTAANPGSTYAGGTLRFDMVTISGAAIPEPSSFVLAGLAVAGFGRRFIRRK